MWLIVRAIGLPEAVNGAETYSETGVIAPLTPFVLVIVYILYYILCPRHEMTEGHIEFTLSVCVCSRIVSGP